MGWTKIARREHDRSGLRYASDCTDAEWAVVRPFFRRTSRVGRPRKHKARTLWDAIQYIAATGCQWAQLPKDFPPFTTVQYHFYRMRDNGLLDAVNAVLVAWVRVAAGREAEPSAGIIDSQSVKTTEAGGPRGYDAGKKIKGRKRHIVTDTLGNMLEGVVHGADVQDRDGAPGLIERSCDAYPRPYQAVRRWRLCRAEARRGSHAHRSLDDRNHQTVRPGGLCHSAPALGRRAYPGVAQPVPSPRQGLGGIDRVVRSLDGRLIHQANDAPYCQNRIMSRALKNSNHSVRRGMEASVGRQSGRIHPRKI